MGSSFLSQCKLPRSATNRQGVSTDYLSGAYGFDDVLMRFSTDQGATWGFAPIKVNSDAQPRMGYGHDHDQPGIAVDATGKVAACWYDRRNDVANFGIE